MSSTAAIDARAFRKTCAKFATGITVAAVIGDDDRPHGMTANAFTSVSLEPPLLLVCVDYNSNLLPHFRAAKHYGISILGEHQEELSNRFAQRGIDRFEGTEWFQGSTGVPLISGAIAHFECAVRNVVEAGDHAIFLGEVQHLGSQEGKPLLYFASGYQRLA